MTPDPMITIRMCCPSTCRASGFLSTTRACFAPAEALPASPEC